MPIVKTVALKTRWTEGVVTLEVKDEGEFGRRYTVWLGPPEKEKQGRTRIEFSAENWETLKRLIAYAGL